MPKQVARFLINRVVGADLVVSIEGRRACVIKNYTKPIDESGFKFVPGTRALQPGFAFLPGMLLSAAESRPYIEAVQ